MKHVVRSDCRGGWVVYRETSHREGNTYSVRWSLDPMPFRTWREAMDYADRRARTVEVVLPAPEVNPPVDVHSPAWHVSEGLTRPWVAVIGGSVWMTDRRGWGDKLDANTAERLGLALLTAAKHAKGKLLADQEES